MKLYWQKKNSLLEKKNNKRQGHQFYKPVKIVFVKYVFSFGINQILVTLDLCYDWCKM